MKFKSMHKLKHRVSNFPQRILLDGFLETVQRLPKKEVCVVEGRSYTYEKLLKDSTKLASAMLSQGVNKGDRVAIYMDNTWECIVSIYGVIQAGGVFVIINPQTKINKLETILKDSGATLLITDYHIKIILSLLETGSTSIKNILAVSETIEDYKVCITLQRFEQVLKEADVNLPNVKIVPGDLAALIYTSGSTGIPKGVMQTHQAMVFTIWSLVQYLKLSEVDRILLVLPMAFDYGLYQLLMSVTLGATLIVERSFTYPAQIYKRIIEQKVSVFPAVPTICTMLISSLKKDDICFPDIKTVSNTAAVLPPEYIPHLRLIFPNALIFSMYGLTECKRVSYLDPALLDEKPTSVGKAIPGTEVYLLSHDGKPVLPGEEGILYVRGPHVMAGYWNNPDATNKYLKPGFEAGEKILCTHDRFRMDENGFLYFLGRSDDILKIRGEKVSPVEIENVLRKMTDIVEAAVVGIKDELLGHFVRAYVVIESSSELTERKIKRHCLEQMENYMVPKEIVFLDKLPRTANGKIDKLILAQI